jgi:hypothetical protein
LARSITDDFRPHIPIYRERFDNHRDMRIESRVFCAAALAALVSVAGCGKSLPGAPSVPSKPASLDKVPSNLPSGEVDPNTCANYAAVDAGRKLKAFLQAVKDLETTATETVKVVKQSCVMMGQELGMPEPDLTGETNAVCDKVIATYQNNLKVTLKANAKLTVRYEPAVCTVDAQLAAKAGAECEGGAGAGGAGGSCKAAAGVKASLEMKCTEPKLVLEADKGIVLDKTKLEMTLKALRDGLPKLLSIKARLAPLKAAAEETVRTAAELKAMGPKFTQSFPDQGVCIAGQLAASVNALTHVQANISVSVSVTASASATAGG